MNSNKFICVLISILIGFLAKAENKSIVLLQPADTFAAVIVHADHSQQVAEYTVFKSNAPDHKSRKIRPRFRGVTAFEIQSNSSTQSGFSLYKIPAKLTTCNNGHVLPFYYVFLFRLTPF